jgi:hypothetical protein
VRLNAAASSGLRSALAGPPRPATWLGVTPAALYFRTGETPGVLALLTHDAVRLPCALLLPTTTAQLPLTSVADPGGGALSGDAMTGDAMIGDNSLAWTGPAGPVVVRAVREWAPARVRPAPEPVRPAPELRGWGSAVPLATADPQPRCWAAVGALAALGDALPAPAALGIDGALLTLLTTDPATGVAALLGRGPGLTPAGDDVLAGFLLAARAVGLEAGAARAAVAAMAPVRTTALSAALLWHAARGECIPEAAAVAAALTKNDRTEHKRTGHGLTGHCELEPALGRLLAIGHTSGGALAVGLATAATAAANLMGGTPLTLYQQQGSNHDVSTRRAGAGTVTHTGGAAA